MLFSRSAVQPYISDVQNSLTSDSGLQNPYNTRMIPVYISSVVQNSYDTRMW